jgi:hypothetical protein
LTRASRATKRHIAARTMANGKNSPDKTNQAGCGQPPRRSDIPHLPVSLSQRPTARLSPPRLRSRTFDPAIPPSGQLVRADRGFSRPRTMNPSW